MEYFGWYTIWFAIVMFSVDIGSGLWTKGKTDKDEDKKGLGFLLHPILSMISLVIGIHFAANHFRGYSAKFDTKTEVGVLYTTIARYEDTVLIKSGEKKDILFLNIPKDEVPDLFMVTRERKIISIAK